VAQVLGVTVQAVKTRIFRAREMLLSRLSKDISA
jgi:DNA-directed RNA polymerase specialized sigma24 family protein